MGSMYGCHCFICDYIGEKRGSCKDKCPVSTPDCVNCDGCNRNLERGGNGERKPSTSEKPGNIRNGPEPTHLPQYQCPHRKLARAGEDEVLERLYRRETRTKRRALHAITNRAKAYQCIASTPTLRTS
ncbi:hypothetical protein PHYBLDRAFT_151235 [Phycomyces blakesleeanus NRRL 1555(-)]|uniref:Uncharacterized protein n=1 Tax=Phycomyces blakesleeanus (strain ATCC 8743b / DSM 1359 / FGSC 10004 / NBRC 33097 / NRRL 1555) TaxID=763407 RepID=A0A167KBU0_PHYB8|nr:hypothetical protein PHYBLDRAFT_151235 [Phycomyces blakesleeanus NRRL 1555(-)]OAD67709.1 hypothetical protein PHYBLDRAFT_151235 [Phycomyces blakesleeanus NRRL 1555(-)]|eukprot:XP_018285749.1 hypothetical protein PHYBLDRAFT_151235 [Phycomyces blakesleeanus NRRL 1555(-)]